MLVNQDFSILKCATPEAWLKDVVKHKKTLLVDHAHCEKKAARMALRLINNYSEHTDLLIAMVQIAREELLHFKQVLLLIEKRQEHFYTMPSSRYASRLHTHIRSEEPGRLVDLLLIGAFIEARSCERFSCLSQILSDDIELADYYAFLYKAERRHYETYIHLARKYSKTDIEPRVAEFAEIEKELIVSPDKQYLLHSGPIVSG